MDGESSLLDHKEKNVDPEEKKENENKEK